MADSFTPVTLSDGSGVALDATYFNRLEAGIDSADTRAGMLERGVASLVDITYSAVITPNATQGSLFRCQAPSSLTLNAPTGGVDGQIVTVAIRASGGEDITVAFDDVTTVPDVVPAGTWWIGKLTFHAATDKWVLGG